MAKKKYNSEDSGVSGEVISGPNSFVVVAVFVLIACIAVAAYMVAPTMSMSAEDKAYIEQAKDSIEKATEEYEKLKNEVEDAEDVDVEYVKKELVSAKGIGNEVAKLQNSYTYDADKRLSELFDDEHAATQWQMGGTWEFCTNYEVAAKTVPCTWMCRNKKGELLASVSSEYDSEADIFHGFDIIITAQGLKARDDMMGHE